MQTVSLPFDLVNGIYGVDRPADDAPDSAGTEGPGAQRRVSGAARDGTSEGDKRQTGGRKWIILQVLTEREAGIG